MTEKDGKKLCAKKRLDRRPEEASESAANGDIQIVIFSAGNLVDFGRCLCYNEHRFKLMRRAKTEYLLD